MRNPQDDSAWFWQLSRVAFWQIFTGFEGIKSVQKEKKIDFFPLRRWLGQKHFEMATKDMAGMEETGHYSHYILTEDAYFFIVPTEFCYAVVLRT